MQSLKVSLVQTTLVWNSPEENLVALGERISNIKDTDLILLPEMFTTSFSVKEDAAEIAYAFQDKTLAWLKDIATKLSSTLAGSIIWKEDEKFFNRMIWMSPSGEFETYNKRHAFSYGGEDKVFTCGSERKVFEINGWRVLPQICYDLRFPVWARNQDDYDVLINVANWPKVRRDAWRTLLKARAIENQAYSIGVNRIGKDPNVQYAGDSIVYDPWGELILDAEDKDGVFSFELDPNLLKEIREKYPFLNDRDSFSILT